MPESTSLAVNATTTMKVTAMFQNDTNISSSTNEQQTISIAVNAVQDDGNGGFTPTPTSFTGTIYRWNTNQVFNNINLKSSYIYANSAGSMGPSDIFNSMEECVAKYSTQETYYCQLAENILGQYTTDPSTLNKTYYLKNDVEDDIITASYVCFVYNNAEHCMKGTDNGASFAANTQIIKEYQEFYNLNDVTNPSTSNPGCTFSSSSSICYGGGFIQVNANSTGLVNVNGSSSENCFVGSDGYSRCNQW